MFGLRRDEYRYGRIVIDGSTDYIDQVVIMSEVELLGLKTVYNTLLCVKCLLEYFYSNQIRS